MLIVNHLSLFARRNMDNYVVGTNDKFTLNIVVHNYGEDAYESMLYLEIPEDINLVHVKTVSGDTNISACTASIMILANMLL